MTPFVSRSLGARRVDRIREARAVACRFALAYGAVVTALFFLGAPAVAGLFSDDPAVVAIIVTNIRVVSFGYGLMEVHRTSGFILTGLQRPVATTILNAILVIALLIPSPGSGRGSAASPAPSPGASSPISSAGRSASPGQGEPAGRPRPRRVPAPPPRAPFQAKPHRRVKHEARSVARPRNELVFQANPMLDFETRSPAPFLDSSLMIQCENLDFMN